jgi:hypothetical protein
VHCGESSNDNLKIKHPLEINSAKASLDNLHQTTNNITMSASNNYSLNKTELLDDNTNDNLLSGQLFNPVKTKTLQDYDRVRFKSTFLISTFNL